MEPHAPYIPQRDTRSELGDALQEEWLDLTDGIGGVDPQGPGGRALMRDERALSPLERQHLEAAYRGEVHDLDRALGSLLRELRERDLYEDTWILVTSDHGEFLGEHRLLGHRSELYDAGIAIPLIVKHPGSTRTDPTRGIVQPVDLLPSLAEPFGFAVPERVEGTRFDAVEERPAVAEHYEDVKLVRAFGRRFAGHRRAFVAAPYKLIRYSAHPPQLFHERHDPQELRNLVDHRPALAKRLDTLLRSWIDARKPLSTDAPQPELSPEERKRLESLGYL
jgi:arylsulfatase A-like enzyme